MMNTPYTHVAKIYDELMQHVTYDEWASFYHNLLQLSQIKIHNLLEIGCGTGQFTKRLAKYYHITAFDTSSQMLELAKTKLRKYQNITLLHADLLTLNMDKHFDAAIAAYDVLNCLLTLDDLQKAFKNIHKHLKPKARLIFDLNTPYAFEQNLFDEEVHEENYRHLWKSDYNPKTRIVTVNMNFVIKTNAFQEIHTQRAHSISEIKTILSALNFNKINVFDANTLNVPTTNTDRWLFTAQKN